LRIGSAPVTGDSAVEWESRNQRLIDQRRITGRTREVPTVRVPLALVTGEPVECRQLPAIAIAPGVAATLGWGPGALLERVEMQPAAICTRSRGTPLVDPAGRRSTA
jgi:hypothetical protein